MKLVLATTSELRKKAFQNLGLDFVCEESGVDERTNDRPTTPKELVLYLAKKKAEVVAQRQEDALVIGFDSVGYFNGEILEKPKNREEAFTRLQKLGALSRQEHYFYTGVHMAMAWKGEVVRSIHLVDEAKIHMRTILDEDINRYLDQGNGYLKLALGYDFISGLSSTFARKVEGDVTNVAYGIPMSCIPGMMAQILRKDIIHHKNYIN